MHFVPKGGDKNMQNFFDTVFNLKKIRLLLLSSVDTVNVYCWATQKNDTWGSVLLEGNKTICSSLSFPIRYFIFRKFSHFHRAITLYRSIPIHDIDFIIIIRWVRFVDNLCRSYLLHIAIDWSKSMFIKCLINDKIVNFQFLFSILKISTL